MKMKAMMTLSLDKKQEGLNAMDSELKFALYDVVPDIVFPDGSTHTLSREELAHVYEECSDAGKRAVLEGVMSEEIVYDKVISIEEISNERPWVYDLTVENTKNFNISSGLALRDTFHLSGYSGASTAVRGVPRLKELLHVSKNIKTPIMTIYAQPDYSQDMNMCKEIMNMIQTTYLRDLVKSSSIYYDPSDSVVPLDKPFLDLYNEWKEVNPGMCPKVSSSPWMLRLELDRSSMLATSVTMMDVERVLNDYYEDSLSCMFSDDNAEMLVCRIRILDEDDKIGDMLTELKALEQGLMESVTIKGVHNISKASMYKRDTNDATDIGRTDNKGVEVYDEGRDAFERSYEWVISTAGTNLREILTNSYIDQSRTVSNDVVEIYNVLGIEAARQALFDEIMAVLADAYVNFCHVSLLIDTMTNKGHLSSINRHGINRNDIGPLAKSSFEQTTDILVKAGVFAEHDRMTGVSANVMMGQIPRFGTGDSEILIDPSMLTDKRNVPASEPIAVSTTTTATGKQATADMFKMDFDLDI